MRNLEGDLKFFFLITQAILKCWQRRKQFKNHFKKLFLTYMCQSTNQISAKVVKYYYD